MIPFDETKHPASKRAGVASEATIITPIKIGRVEEDDSPYPTYLTYRKRLELVLDGLQTRASRGMPTPVGLLRQIHFARWVILERPGGPGDLLFTSNFDGDMKHYFRTFALQLTGDIDRVWENCEGYPGAIDFDRLWQYVKDHQVTTRTFYDAYPSLTMPEIGRIDALKQKVSSLAPTNTTVSGALLQSAQLPRPPAAPRSLPGNGGGAAKPLDKTDIQTNILGMPPWQRADYRFLTITDPLACRLGLLNLSNAGAAVGFISADEFLQHKDARSQGGEGLPRSLNIAFTSTGLRRLGLAKEYVGGMPLAFQQGMAERADILGDIDDWAPDRWQGMLGSRDIHILISTHASADNIDAYWPELVTSAQGGAAADVSPEFPGCRTIHKERGQRSESGGYLVEPFGFRDGIGQPLIEGVDNPGSNPGALIPPGEFILGYGDVDGNDPVAEKTVGAPMRELCVNGTFLVFRKIEQDAAAFASAAGANGLAERLFGRTKDGRSLADTTTKSDLDDFSYDPDPGGGKCPFGSHVRRLNPRNDESRRHRIIRRGIPYQDGQKQGMLFVCLNARIDSQFEFLQSEWCEKGDFLGSFTDARDPVIGGGAVFFDPAGSGPVKLDSFVTVKGGDYFFMPGLAALRGIATGKFDLLPDAGIPGKDPPPPAIDPALFAELMFDPFEPLDAENPVLPRALLGNRSIEQKRISWGSGPRQSVYYVACRDHVRQILADDVTFPSDQYARKIAALLASYDFRAWLRDGEAPPDLGAIKRVMLGMTHDDPEKKERLRMLYDALGAASVEDLKKNLAAQVDSLAQPILTKALTDNPTGFDIVSHVAYPLPLLFAIKCLGFPALAGFSETYQALFFGRESIDDAKATGFLDLFPQGPARAALPPELQLLIHTIAVFLLIDQYETPSALRFAQLAVRELLDRLAAEVLAEQDRIAKGTAGSSLLSKLLSKPSPGVDDATFRMRVGMIIVELGVGGIDTAAKGVANVVDALLSYPPALQAAQQAAAAGADSKLDNLILECLRLNPVAPLIVRECPNGGTLDLPSGTFTFESGSRILLITAAAMRDPVGAPVNLQNFVLDDSASTLATVGPIRRLAFGDGAHGCLGSETVVAEIRAVLKPLLAPDKKLRRAAGPKGRKQEDSKLPVSLEVRFD